MLDRVSVIVPVRPGEEDLDCLRGDLEESGLDVIVSSEGTRARSLNHGARRADRSFYWFLHADCRVSEENLSTLSEALYSRPDSLMYFDLAFAEAGLARLNAMGANLRSRLLGFPFGDQGFCMSRDVFERLQGFPEGAPYGEDLLLVCRAHKRGVPLHRIPSKLTTSPRKYQTEGWFRTTMVRQYRWIKLVSNAYWFSMV